MGKTVFGNLSWNGPPARFQVNIVPVHQTHLADALSGKQKHFKVGTHHRSEMDTGVPDQANFFIG
jgi:hypothetical protein